MAGLNGQAGPKKFLLFNNLKVSFFFLLNFIYLKKIFFFRTGRTDAVRKIRGQLNGQAIPKNFLLFNNLKISIFF